MASSSLEKGLDIDLLVKENQITPGQYMIPKFNLAKVKRAQDLNAAAESLSANIIWSLEEFYRNYHQYLGGSIKLHSCTSHTLSEAKSREDTKYPLANIKGATVKGMLDLEFSIQKCLITGISPVCLANNTSGFNITVNMSFKKDAAGLYGLTRMDAQEAFERICPIEEDMSTHLERLTRYAKGYHFCCSSITEPVFNTDTSLEYLQAVLTGDEFDIANLPNSEVSQHFLHMCASSPGAVYQIQFGLQDLKSRALGDIEDTNFHTLLLYWGAFTFDKEYPTSTKLLMIPNRVVAKRFGTSILWCYKLHTSMQNAVRFLALDGNIIAPLAGYLKSIAERDVREDGYSMTEADHRDSFHIIILGNPGLDPEVEYEVTKPSGGSGLVDLVITPSKHCIVIEWKSIPIHFLDVGGFKTVDEKTKYLSTLDGTLRSWIKKEVTQQLKSYVISPQIGKLAENWLLRAYLIVVVGSQKLFIWEIGVGGDWVSEPVLAQ
ncbi:hypothetical protein B9Z19DRAFT_1134955 [Tuber borchii]|uniref:Uncharacterized protein n=1 Tax=Tuber borchii TaxID=42251 RepID=A0A2T6ZDK5_TUBBO|nr:hypothetical protein B9Z19DRAFT_1134955 [Tuber borchii]